MTQDELKTLVGQAALQFVRPGQILGVGTGSTVDRFIDALATIKSQIPGAVSSSVRSTERLTALGIPVLDANDVERLSVYVDGADEIDHQGFMIKGGGAALTREKIIADMADQFICIVDESKVVPTLGRFPLPVEVIPMAAQHVLRRLANFGGQPQIRSQCVTDNGNLIIDVKGLEIQDPLSFEKEVSVWAGVVTVGVFAVNRANVALVGGANGVKQINY